MQPDNLQLVIAALQRKPHQSSDVVRPFSMRDPNEVYPDPQLMDDERALAHRVGNYVGQIQPGTPQYQNWMQDWGEAIQKPQDPSAYMKGLPEGIEGATFPNNDMLWMRHGQPDKTQNTPMSEIQNLQQLLLAAK